MTELSLDIDEIEEVSAPDSEFVAGFVFAVGIGGLAVMIT